MAGVLCICTYHQRLDRARMAQLALGPDVFNGVDWTFTINRTWAWHLFYPLGAYSVYCRLLIE